MKRVPALPLARFGVSFETDLLAKFDTWISENGYPNRTEALRALVRKEFVQEQWDSNEEVAGAISLIYDHHKPELLSSLAHLQHEHPGLVVSGQHIHLDHHNCLEILAVRGKANRVQELFNKMRSFKGIKRASLTPMSTGTKLP